MPVKMIVRRARGFLGLVLAAALAAGCGSDAPKESVAGTIRLAPSLPPEARRLRQLFIYLEPAQGGPPFAIQRLVEPAFPHRFVLTPDDAFARGQGFAGQVRVRARLLDDKRVDHELEPLRQSRPPAPLTRGTYEGTSAGAVPAGAQDVEVVINRAGTAEPPKEVAKKPSGPPAAPSPMPPATQATPPQAQTQMPQAPAAPPRAPGPPPAAGQAPAPSPGGAAITGTIVLAPKLASKGQGKPALFLIAWPAQPGPPVAVARIANPTFPLSFRLSQEHVMMPGVKLEGNVRLVARVDADGSAGPAKPGDLEGQLASVAVGSAGVTLTVDKEH